MRGQSGFCFSTLGAAAAAVTVLATTSFAQPSNRPAAFQGAIQAASVQAPGWVFFEADLENDSGHWVIEVQVVSLSGTAMLEYEVDASSLVVERSRAKSLSSGKIAEIQAALAVLPAATISASQAISIAAVRTPDGTLMQHIELGVQSGHPAYKFDFAGSLGVQRVTVDASTGLPASSSGPTTPPPGSGVLTLDQAIASVLNLYPGSRVLEVEFESSDARWEVRLVTAQGEARKVRVSAAGVLLSDDQHRRGREDAADDRLRSVALQGASVSLAQARAVALASAPGAVAIKAEWEFEHGVLVAKVTVQDALGLRVIFVNAATGAVVTPVPDAPPAAQPAPTVDVASASSIGTAANPGSAAVEVEMELKGGRQFYKVKTLSLTLPLRLREVVVDGKTGFVWSNTLLPMSASYLPVARQIVALLPTVTKSFANAKQIALSTLGDGVVQSIELEVESTPQYHVDVVVGQRTFSLIVDARTGAVRPR